MSRSAASLCNPQEQLAHFVRCATCCPVVLLGNKSKYENNLRIRSGLNWHLDLKNNNKKSNGGFKSLMTKLKKSPKLEARTVSPK